jgi:hypothetical protein
MYEGDALRLNNADLYVHGRQQKFYSYEAYNEAVLMFKRQPQDQQTYAKQQLAPYLQPCDPTPMIIGSKLDVQRAFQQHVLSQRKKRGLINKKKPIATRRTRWRWLLLDELPKVEYCRVVVSELAEATISVDLRVASESAVMLHLSYPLLHVQLNVGKPPTNMFPWHPSYPSKEDLANLPKASPPFLRRTLCLTKPPSCQSLDQTAPRDELPGTPCQSMDQTASLGTPRQSMVQSTSPDELPGTPSHDIVPSSVSPDELPGTPSHDFVPSSV